MDERLDKRDIFDERQMVCPKCGEKIIVAYSDGVPNEMIGVCYMCWHEWIEKEIKSDG